MHIFSTDSSPLSPSATDAAALTRDWVCPFCPLLCDDLVAASYDDGTLAVPDTECSRLAQALAQYSATDAQCVCVVDGRDVDLDAALARAAQWLANARRPLFGGLATDVAGTRALYPLAAACGAILDHLHGDALTPATLALQDRGSFFTTLSEVRARADLLVFFGCQPSRRYPRFFTRVLAGTDLARELVFVGCDADPAADGFAQARIDTLLRDADPFDMLARWSALAEGRNAGAATELASLHARMVAAR